MAEIHHLLESIVLCNINCIVLQGNSALLILNWSQSQKARVVLLTPQLSLTGKLMFILMNTLFKQSPFLHLQRKAATLIP